MTAPLLDAGMALWLGLLTSISPCPLATNITAIAFVGRNIKDTKRVFLSGVLYTSGRMLSYLIVGVIVINSILSIPGVSFFLQHYMNKILGPVLLIAGVFLLDIMPIYFKGSGISGFFQTHFKFTGVWGAGVLGFVFALAFCPVSAALFFGGLVPLAVKSQSHISMPLLYGIGTALPVIVFAFLIAVSAKYVGIVFDKLAAVELWLRRGTAAVFIGVSIYLIWNNNLKTLF